MRFPQLAAILHDHVRANARVPRSTGRSLPPTPALRGRRPRAHHRSGGLRLQQRALAAAVRAAVRRCRSGTTSTARRAPSRPSSGTPPRTSTAKVSVQWRPGNYDQQTAAALLTDAGPGRLRGRNGPNLDQIQGGQVVDLDRRDRGGAATTSTRRCSQPKTYEGKVYGIPQVIDMQMLYYRKSLLANAGVQPPAHPRRTGGRGQGADHQGRQGALPRQRRRRRRPGRHRRCARPGCRLVTADGKVGLRRPGGGHAPWASCTRCTPTSRCCWARPPTGRTRRRSSRG